MVGMLASVGTSSAARYCLEDEFGGEYQLEAANGALHGLASLESEGLAAVVSGTIARGREVDILGLNIFGDCPLIGGISMTIVLDARTGLGFATGLITECFGSSDAFCQDGLEGGVCGLPAIAFRRCDARDPREKSKGPHPFLTP
jgi:hypothetical protein